MMNVKKHTNKLHLIWLHTLLLLFLNHPVQAQLDPLGMMLTWQQDPTTTMTLDWYTPADNQNSFIEYRAIPFDEEEDEWVVASGDHFEFPHSDRLIHRVEVTGLEPDKEYQFRVGEFTRIRKFRTMPAEALRPVRIAVGGDVRHRIEWMDQTNRRAARYDPDFVLWGGDLAYADGMEERVYRWYEFLESTMRTLMTDDGRVIPVLSSLGNHEVLGGYYYRDEHDRRDGLPEFYGSEEHKEMISPYYYALFAFPGHPGYGVLDFGDYLSVVILDTDHNNPIDGEQTEWLEEILNERQDIPHIFPTYHNPAYPSVRNPEWDSSDRVRENWVPLFEEYGVRVVFEKHDHIYKRTFPILEDQINSKGVVYIGDGAWGVGTREIGRSHEEHAWYLDRAASERHFILTTIHGAHQHFLMINEDGQIIDEYPQTPHTDFSPVRMAEPWLPAEETEFDEDEEMDSE